MRKIDGARARPHFPRDAARPRTNLFTVKHKPKSDPRVNAEDELFRRGSEKSRELLKKSRVLKRDEARKAWAKENL